MRTQLVDVYHAGDRNRPKAPFLVVLSGLSEDLPPAPNGFRSWTFWKQVQLNQFAVEPGKAARQLVETGFYIQ